jgi:HemY protein
VKILFTVLTVLLVAVALGWWLQDSPGAVIFTYKEWMIQTSLVVFALASIALFLLAYVLFRLLRKLLQLPGDFRHWSEYRRRRRAEKFLNQGLLSMMEGNWPGAERAFRKGAAFSQAPLVNYLGAAQAAYRQGDTHGCDRYLGLARRHDEAGSPAAGLTLARLQMDQQQLAQANDTLSSLEREHEQVKLMLLETATEMKDWARAAALFQECRRRGLMSAEQARAKQLTFQAGLLRQAGNEQDKAALENAWRNIPGKLKKESALIGAYVKERLRRGDSSDCEAMLRRALKRQWDPELVRLYGLVEGRNLKQQLEFAGNWLARFPQDAALLLTLGRLCKKNHLWGKARSYLEQSIQARPDPATCQELATLFEQQGEHAAARSYFQEGLNLATGAHETGETGTALVVSERESAAGMSGRP